MVGSKDPPKRPETVYSDPGVFPLSSATVTVAVPCLLPLPMSAFTVPVTTLATWTLGGARVVVVVEVVVVVVGSSVVVVDVVVVVGGGNVVVVDVVVVVVVVGSSVVVVVVTPQEFDWASGPSSVTSVTVTRSKRNP